MMYKTSDNSQLPRRVLWINAQLTIVWSLKHHRTQTILIFNRENPQNSESPNSPRRGTWFHSFGYIWYGPFRVFVTSRKWSFSSLNASKEFKIKVNIRMRFKPILYSCCIEHDILQANEQELIHNMNFVHYITNKDSLSSISI